MEISHDTDRWPPGCLGYRRWRRKWPGPKPKQNVDCQLFREAHKGNKFEEKNGRSSYKYTHVQSCSEKKDQTKTFWASWDDYEMRSEFELRAGQVPLSVNISWTWFKRVNNQPINLHLSKIKIKDKESIGDIKWILGDRSTTAPSTPVTLDFPKEMADTAAAPKVQALRPNKTWFPLDFNKAV